MRGTKLGSKACRTAVRPLVMLTPIMDAEKPTSSSLKPLRSTAPHRCCTVKGAWPSGTFWKAFSGQLARKRCSEFWFAVVRGLRVAPRDLSHAAGHRRGLLGDRGRSRRDPAAWEYAHPATPGRTRAHICVKFQHRCVWKSP